MWKTKGANDFPEAKDGGNRIVKERKSERPLWLSEEEAMGLLDIALVAPSELTPEQRAAVSKLSEFCRLFLRNPEEAAPPHPALVAPPNLSKSFVA